MSQRDEWRTIESAPKDGTEVLIWDGASMVVAMWRPNLLIPWRGTYGDGDAAWEPTHWMPLPPAPKGETDNG